MNPLTASSIVRSQGRVVTRWDGPDGSVTIEDRPVSDDDALSADALSDLPAVIAAMRGDKTAADRQAAVVAVMDAAVSKEAAIEVVAPKEVLLIEVVK